MKNLFFALTFLLFASVCLSAQIRDVREIRITSTWGGLGKPEKSELIITRKSKGYFVGGEKIEKRLIDDLLQAIDQPEMTNFDPANLGITQEWLDANAQKGIEEYASYSFSTGAKNQQDLYYSTFRDMSAIEKILPSVLRGGWTDDYPRFGVEITETDSTKTIVGSDEQPLFMLPWEIIKNGRTVHTYNADISRSLVALLPKKFTNRKRLAGESLNRELAQAVMWHIKDQWEALGAKNKAGDALKILESDYQVSATEINSTHDKDFGKKWEKGSSGEKNLHAVLTRESFPKGFSVSLILPFQNGKVENLDVFQNKIEDYRNLVFSVDWLKNHIGTKGGVQLRFVRDSSFSRKALETFTADMNGIGRSSLAVEAERDRDRIALILVGGGLDYYKSYWLVLPDKRVILWRYGYASLLNWSEKDFETKKCSDYQATVGGCVGAVISPEGAILSK
ncbi:MAG: hypothetical protein R2747_21925 [Pyrinomonadaceae bacterium]